MNRHVTRAMAGPVVFAGLLYFIRAAAPRWDRYLAPLEVAVGVLFLVASAVVPLSRLVPGIGDDDGEGGDDREPWDDGDDGDGDGSLCLELVAEGARR